MAIGCFLLGAGFLAMVPPAMMHAAEGMPVNFSWLILFTLLATLGELFLSPIGLSLVTKWAPPRMVSMMMGVWFLSSFAGNSLAGLLGQYWERMAKDLFFLMITGIAVGAGVALLLIWRPLRRAISGEETMW